MRTLSKSKSPQLVAPVYSAILPRAPDLGGRPLDRDTRTFMESRFVHDFSGVRVHTGADAAASAAVLGAKAYTVGRHIVLGGGQPSPESPSARPLLAHELAHVVQQRRGGAAPAVAASAAHEMDARSAATSAMSGRVPVRVETGTAIGWAREEKGGGTALPLLTAEDPTASPRYIDTIFQRVSYSLVFGVTTFKWEEHGKEKLIRIPFNDLDQNDAQAFVALWKVHKSKEEAMQTVRAYREAAPGFAYYSFYMDPEGVIMPTSFSKGSTPLFHAMWPALRQSMVEEAEDIRKGMQQLANVINPFPGTTVDEYGNLGLSGNPMDWLALLKLNRLRRIKKAGPIRTRRHSGYNVPYRVTGPHDKLKGTSVYVLKDAEGTVLYVGKGETLNRLREHIKDPKKTQWFGEIDRLEVRGTDLNNTQALALEQDLIQQLKPTHNIDRTPFNKEFGNTMEVGPNLPRPQKTLEFHVEWGH
jgi:hypothetical protein